MKQMWQQMYRRARRQHPARDVTVALAEEIKKKVLNLASLPEVAVLFLDPHETPTPIKDSQGGRDGLEVPEFFRTYVRIKFYIADKRKE
jgi:hypothetical protein